MKEDVIIPENGLISLGYLSKLTGVNIERLTQALADSNIPFLKIGGYRKDWYVNLKKLADVAYGGGEQ